MDDLLAGKLILPFGGRLLAIFTSSAVYFRRLWQTFRSKPITVPLAGRSMIVFRAELLIGFIPES
jgi:hypothetical protein